MQSAYTISRKTWYRCKPWTFCCISVF